MSRTLQHAISVDQQHASLWSARPYGTMLLAACTWRGGRCRHKPRHHAAADVQRKPIVPAGQLLSHGLHLAVAGQLTGCQDCSPRLTGSSKQMLLIAYIDVSLMIGCPGIAWMMPPGQGTPQQISSSHRCWHSATPEAADAVLPHYLPNDHHWAALSVLLRLQPHLQIRSKMPVSFDCQ